MKLYLIENSCYCPLDNGFLKREKIDETPVFSCPVCGKRYVHAMSRIPAGVTVSDGFIKSRKMVRQSEKKAQEYRLVLKMTIEKDA